MQNSAVVMFNDGSTIIRVFLPTEGTPKNVAGVFLAITHHLERTSMCAGQTAADFIGAINAFVRPSILLGGDGAENADWVYELTKGPLTPHNVKVWNKYRVLFDGKLYAFTEWPDSFTGLEHLVGKIVRFRYDGGSNPGAIRTVRVEKVGPAELEGNDLEKPDLNRSYRRYCRSKIAGDFTLVN